MSRLDNTGEEIRDRRKEKIERNKNVMKLENLQHVDQARKPQRLKAVAAR